MKLTLGEKTYTESVWDLYWPALGPARTIKRHTGMTLIDWRIGLMTWSREDPDVLAALVYLFKHRAGEIVDWPAIDGVGSHPVVTGLEWEDSDQEIVDGLQRSASGDARDGSEGAASEQVDPPPPPEAATAEAEVSEAHQEHGADPADTAAGTQEPAEPSA